jgi:hypothetical protein
MTFDEYVDFLGKVVEDPNELPESEEEVEEMILDVCGNLDMEQFVTNAPALLLSLMLHQAALQGCMNLMQSGEDLSEIFEPTVH